MITKRNDTFCPLKAGIRDQIHLLKREKRHLELVQMMNQLDMSKNELDELLRDPEIVLRQDQLIRLFDFDNPDSIEKISIMLAARASGKSVALGGCLVRALEHGFTNILIITQTSRDARITIGDAISNYIPRTDFAFKTNLNQYVFEKYPNVEVICVPSAAGVDAVRGLNNQLVLVDEAAFCDSEMLDLALMTARRDPCRMLCFTSPKANSEFIVRLYRQWKENPDNGYVRIYGSSMKNNYFLPQSFIDGMIQQYQGTRLYNSEILGILELSSETALLSPDEIDKHSIAEAHIPPFVNQSEDYEEYINEVCIGVDPAVLSKKSNGGKGKRTPDMCGIVTAGKSNKGKVYVLNDSSGSFPIDKLIGKLVTDFEYYREKNCLVRLNIESNNFGEEVLDKFFKESSNSQIAKFVNASFSTENKLARATPHAMSVQKGDIIFPTYLDGRLVELQTELVSYDGTGKSPNRMDAWTLACDLLMPVRVKKLKSRQLL